MASEKRLLDRNARHRLFNEKTLLLIASILACAGFCATTVLHFTRPAHNAEFFLGVFSMIPISVIVQTCSEDLSLRLQHHGHEVAAGLSDAIFRNCVEFVFAIVALVGHEAKVAQTALTGGILTNTLLILGTCFFMGGFQKHTQTYPAILARLKSTLLIIGVASLMLPTAHKLCAEEVSTQGSGLTISRSASVVHLVLFVSYLCFFYHTRSDEEKDEDKDKYKYVRNILIPGNIAMAVTPEIAKTSFSPELSWQLRELSRQMREESQKQCGKTPKRPVAVNGILLCACVVVTTFVSLYVVESLEAPHHTLGLSKSFVGLILVPIVYGAAQHVGAAVRAGRKSATHEGTDWIIETALDSSIRISLFILPCVVLLGWALNEPNMSLLFDSFQVILLGIAISLVNYIMHSGSAYWLEGAMLIALYVLMAISIWFYPNDA